MQEWKNKGSRRRRKQRRGLLSHWAVTAARVEICWSLARLSVRLSVHPSSATVTTEPGSFTRSGEARPPGSSGFYLLMLTGRLSLFLRRHVLR